MLERLHGLQRKRRLTPVLQHEHAECGLACIAMIAGWFGHVLSLGELRVRHPPSSRGATLNDLLASAQELGLAGRPLRLDLTDLHRLALPAILHWRMQHFVVLAKIGRRNVIIFDPAIGRRSMRRQELDTNFTGVAVEFTPTLDFAPGNPPKRLALSDFLRGCRRLGRYLGLMLLLLVTVQVLALVPPVATQLLIDEVVLGQDVEWLYRALGGLALVLFVAASLEALRRWIGLYAGSVLAADSTFNVVRHLYRLPAQFVRNRHLGDLVSRLESLAPIRKAITESALDGAVQAAVLLATFGVMFFYSPQLTLVSIAGLLLSALLVAVMLPPMRRAGEQLLVHGAQADSSLLETLRASESILALGLGPLRLVHWQNHFVDTMNARVLQSKLAIGHTFGAGLIGGAEQVLFLGVGIGQLIDKQLTLGVLFAFMTLRNRLGGAALQLFAVLQELFMLKVHIERLSDIVLAEAVPAPAKGAIRRPLRGSLQAQHLSFRYPGGPPVLESFCGVIEPGEAVAIAGVSGCGKTTLLKLFSAQLVPSGGQVLVDGQEATLWHPEQLRRQVATVLQDDLLFRGSIAENIAAFDPEADLGQVRDAADAARIWQDICGMPMGLETLVGDMGSSLSGGQRQRIMLARAFYRQPRILFLDEATSHLDIDTERQVLEYLDTLGITIVSVAHRPDVLRWADRVIRLPGTADPATRPRPVP